MGLITAQLCTKQGLRELRQTLRHRPDIDGLRAIAVVPVVLFHAGAIGFSGGYIGVDIFFVISGYLITSIIVEKVDTNKFSILEFYQRRIRRIFPALAVVVALCLAVGFVFFSPDDYASLGESAVSTTLFVSNIFFWKAIGYFDNAAYEKPLLHTWSLSIEEQFYLVYPIFLWLASRWGAWGRMLTMSLVCLISFAFSAILVSIKPVAGFYFGPTRAWELLLGGLLALGAVPRMPSQTVRNGAAVVGLALVLGPVFLYSASTRFPGVAALPPVVGTALLIWAGQTGKSFVSSLLSNPVCVAIGKASYSLYLWHFPLLAFAGYLTLGRTSTFSTLIICLIATLVSFLSWRFVELPFRHLDPIEVALPISIPVTGMILAAIAGCGVVLQAGFPSRLDGASLRNLDVEHDRDRHHMECMSIESKLVSPENACQLGVREAVPTVLLWGDSHSVITATAMEDAAARTGSSFLFAASVDCPVGLGFSISPSTGPSFVASNAYQFCSEYNNRMLRLALMSPDVKVVVLSSRWSNWRIGIDNSPAELPADIRLKDETGVARSPDENRNIFRHGFERLLGELYSAGKNIVIVGPLPEPSTRIPKALYVRKFGLSTDALDVPIQAFFQRNTWVMNLFRELTDKYQLRFVWPHTALCGAGSCAVTVDGQPAFFDYNHLSLAAAKNTSTLYDDVFLTKFDEVRTRPR